MVVIIRLVDCYLCKTTSRQLSMTYFGAHLLFQWSVFAVVFTDTQSINVSNDIDFLGPNKIFGFICVCVCIYIYKGKVKVPPIQATNALRADRGIALPNLRPRH